MKKKITVMLVGKYAGTPVDQLPNNYLRWMVTQDFPDEIMDIAREKLARSQFNNDPINVTRHALDMFSIRCLELWALNLRASEVGIASFVAEMAQEAWEKGIDVSKHRYDGDGTMKEFKGVKWVFGFNEKFPEYKELITVLLSVDTGNPHLYS